MFFVMPETYKAPSKVTVIVLLEDNSTLVLTVNLQSVFLIVGFSILLRVHSQSQIKPPFATYLCFTLYCADSHNMFRPLMLAIIKCHYNHIQQVVTAPNGSVWLAYIIKIVCQ
jgi:hypothetical protein